MNDDDTDYCKSCGQSLRTRRPVGFSRYDRSLCFGVPMQGHLLGLVLGFILVLWGLSELLNLQIQLWALVVICFGVLIILNVLRRPDSRYR